MRFDIRYADGTGHTVELPGAVLTLGRDPTCDVVLRDELVSRRHAVVEHTPGGLSIRDTDSANGMFLNNRRVTRAVLAPGDRIQLGDTVLLIDEGLLSGALQPAPQSLVDLPLRLTGAAGAWRDSSRVAPGPARPLALSALAALSFCAALVILGGTVVIVVLRGHLDGVAALAAASGLGLALLALTLGAGLLARRPWARLLGIGLSFPAALSCVLAPLALVAAAYLSSRRARTLFVTAAGGPSDPLDARRETAFTLTLAGATLASLAASALLAVHYWTPLHSALEGPTAHEQAVLGRLRAMHGAQESFRRVCNVGYADLEALLNPATVIPHYPASGAAFLTRTAGAQEADGFRFSLTVREDMAPTEDCPTLRRYRTYEYAAAPLADEGPTYLLTSDGRVHVARARPASANDPVLEDPSRAR